MSEEILQAQPLSRVKFLELIRSALQTANGKNGVTAVIESKTYLGEVGELEDKDLLKAIFKQVKDGDERYIVRSFFSHVE